jgi:dynein assembly factor 1
MPREKRKAEPSTDESGNRILTEDFLRDLCEENNQFLTPHLNEQLYLHYKGIPLQLIYTGITKISNLEKYYKLRCIWFESNGLQKIENMETLVHMRTLYESIFDLPDICIRT